MKVAGKNVIIEILVDDTWEFYACATSATLNVVTDSIETSTSGNGKFRTFLPTANSFTGTLEGVTSLMEDSKLSLPDLRQRQLAQETLNIRYQREDGIGNLYTEQGSFFITSSSDVGSFDGMNNFTIEMQGTGILSQSPFTPVVPIPFNFFYGETAMYTVDDGLPHIYPTEDQYVGAVDDVFTDSGELTGSEPNTGDDIEVVDFGNTDYRMVFLQVPASEAPFTMWSEEGNPLQQDQPIDSSFNYGSGAVWFQSTRDGDTLYCTYYQTRFDGPIIFSR